MEIGMGKCIKTGGVGKSPAIEKINRLSQLSSRVQAASLLEKQAFAGQQESARRELVKRRRIIEEFHIDFRKRDEGQV